MVVLCKLTHSHPVRHYLINAMQNRASSSSRRSAQEEAHGLAAAVWEKNNP